MKMSSIDFSRLDEKTTKRVISPVCTTFSEVLLVILDSFPGPATDEELLGHFHEADRADAAGHLMNLIARGDVIRSDGFLLKAH